MMVCQSHFDQKYKDSNDDIKGITIFPLFHVIYLAQYMSGYNKMDVRSSFLLQLQSSRTFNQEEKLGNCLTY